MYHFVVFPYDRTNEKILTWRETTSYGTVTDIVSPTGWNMGGKQVNIGNRMVTIKTKIKDVSNECDSLWVIDNNNKLDFNEDILPVLKLCMEKGWKIFWGRSCTAEERNQIINMDSCHQVYFLGDFEREQNKNRIYDFKIPVIFIVNMFPKMQTDFVFMLLYEAINSLGYKTRAVTYRNDFGMYDDVVLLPDFKKNTTDNRERIIYLNNYLKAIEKEKVDLFIGEIPGNMLEVSKKICGDFGCWQYIFNRALQPDYVICNLPYMDTILENYEMLGAVVSQTSGIDIDYYNVVHSYLDVMESENNEEFEYMSLSEEFIRKKVGKKEKMGYVFDKEEACNIATAIIEKLQEYDNVIML